MRRIFGIVFVALLSTGLALAQTSVSGTTGGGAYYRIVVPDAWNGDLVIWNHGYDSAPPAPDPSLGPLASLHLSEGYAVAASSYEMKGWATFRTSQDLTHLVAAFTSRFGRPRAIWLYGASLGGIVTAQALEDANLGNVVGAFTFCGALAGSRNWDGAVDLRLIYDDVCGDVPGAAIPGGAAGLPVGDPIDTGGMALRVHACTGILAPPAGRTPEQAERLAKILGTTHIPESFLLTDMAFATFELRDLVNAQEKLHGKIGVGNATVYYGDPEIDGTIARVRPNPGAENRLDRNYTPNGSIGPANVVAMHTDKDGLIVVENLDAYASVVDPDHLATAVAIEAAPTHCGFTPAELVAGWESLRAWVAGSPKPSAAVLQGTCQAIVASGAAPGPCRIDPSFVVPSIDGRIRPR